MVENEASTRQAGADTVRDWVRVAARLGGNGTRLGLPMRGEGLRAAQFVMTPEGGVKLKRPTATTVHKGELITVSYSVESEI